MSMLNYDPLALFSHFRFRRWDCADLRSFRQVLSVDCAILSPPHLPSSPASLHIRPSPTAGGRLSAALNQSIVAPIPSLPVAAVCIV